MNPGPVILTLSSWAQSHLEEVLTAKTKKDFDDAFAAFVADGARISVNGKSTSRAAFSKLLWSDEQNDTSGSVAFKGTVEVPKDPKAIIQTGEVGVFFQATLHRAPLLFSNIVTASINLVVAAEKTKSGESPEFDGRQATDINMIFTDVPSNIVQSD